MPGGPQHGTGYTMTAKITLLEVAPRDGFQSIVAPLPTEEKIGIIELLIDAGIRRMEIGSFVSPRAIPQMADIGRIAAHFRDRDDCALSMLVPNVRGATMALEAGYRDLVFVLSVSPAHNERNVRQSIAQSVAQLREIAALLDPAGGHRLRVDLATSFDCPFTGAVSVDALRRVFAATLEAAPEAEFALCDTTGRADPIGVAQRFQTLMADGLPNRTWAFHGHDTFGMGVANALYAHGVGVSIIEGAAAGLGGCPFAPGASGNTATEDLHFAFEQAGIATGIDRAKLLMAADRIALLPQARTGGHLRTVPRARAFA